MRNDGRSASALDRWLGTGTAAGRLLSVVGALVFVVAFVLGAGVVLTRGTVLTEEYYTSALTRTNAYERVYTEVLADLELTELTERLLGRITPDGVDPTEIRTVATNALRWTLPPSRLRAGTEAFIAEVLAYVRGDRPRLQSEISVADVIARIDGTARVELRTFAADTAELVAVTVEEYEDQLAAYADALAAGRVPSAVPVYGGDDFDAERTLDMVLARLGDHVDDRTAAEIRAALLAGEQREALISAGAAIVADHARRLSEELRAGTLSGAGSDIDVVEEIAARSGLDPAAVVADLNAVRDGLSRLQWPLAGLAVAGVLGAGAVAAPSWRNPALTARRFAVLLVMSGVASWVAYAVATRRLPSPLEPAVQAGAGSWHLPGGLRTLLADVEADLASELRRRSRHLVVAPVAVGVALLGAGAAVPLRRHLTRRRLIATGTAAVLAATAGWFVLDTATAAPIRACNGDPVLCDRRYDEVVYAATHNSMSSPDVVFIWPEQDQDLRAQLDHGVRALLIDSHYWTPVLSEADLRAADPLLPPELASRVYAALGPLREARDGTYLCHNHCALGAVPFADALGQIGAFLDDNPDDVVTLIIEDAISPEDTAAAFEQSGLDRYLYVHREGRRWPTLRALIDDDTRLVVFAEQAGPPPPWYHHAWDHIQDTPYRFGAPEELSCRPNRGDPDASLFLMNHWVQRIAPDRADAATVNRHDLIVDRALECREERGLLPNFIAVNFSNVGDVVGAVDTLNHLD